MRIEDIKWGLGTLAMMGAVVSQNLLQRATDQWMNVVNDPNDQENVSERQVTYGVLAGATVITTVASYCLHRSRNAPIMVDVERGEVGVPVAREEVPPEPPVQDEVRAVQEKDLEEERRKSEEEAAKQRKAEEKARQTLQRKQAEEARVQAAIEVPAEPPVQDEVRAVQERAIEEERRKSEEEAKQRKAEERRIERQRFAEEKARQTLLKKQAEEARVQAAIGTLKNRAKEISQAVVEALVRLGNSVKDSASKAIKNAFTEIQVDDLEANLVKVANAATELVAQEAVRKIVSIQDRIFDNIQNLTGLLEIEKQVKELLAPLPEKLAELEETLKKYPELSFDREEIDDRFDKMKTLQESLKATLKIEEAKKIQEQIEELVNGTMIILETEIPYQMMNCALEKVGSATSRFEEMLVKSKDITKENQINTLVDDAKTKMQTMQSVLDEMEKSDFTFSAFKRLILIAPQLESLSIEIIDQIEEPEEVLISTPQSSWWSSIWSWFKFW